VIIQRLIVRFLDSLKRSAFLIFNLFKASLDSFRKLFQKKENTKK